MAGRGSAIFVSGGRVVRFRDTAEIESEPSALGPVAQRFFTILIAVGTFLALPVLLYALYVLTALFRHKR